jgi:hypothetical protein
MEVFCPFGQTFADFHVRPIVIIESLDLAILFLKIRLGWHFAVDLGKRLLVRMEFGLANFRTTCISDLCEETYLSEALIRQKGEVVFLFAGTVLHCGILIGGNATVLAFKHIWLARSKPWAMLADVKRTENDRRTLDLGHLVDGFIPRVFSGAYADERTGNSGLEARIEAHLRKEAAAYTTTLKVLQGGRLFLARKALVFGVIHFALSVGVDI